MSAMARQESRGAHFRDDFPAKEQAFSTVNAVVRRNHDGQMEVTHEPIPEMPRELQEIIEEMK